MLRTLLPRRWLGFVLIFVFALLSGCASVPMGDKTADADAKKFAAPAPEVARLYVYRNAMVGAALTKRVTVDGVVIGETASKTYFVRNVAPGKHTLGTQSEFSDNTLDLDVVGGKNYFIHQYMKIGLFIGGANLELVSEEEGKKGVEECQLAAPFTPK